MRIVPLFRMGLLFIAFVPLSPLKLQYWAKPVQTPSLYVPAKSRSSSTVDSCAGFSYTTWMPVGFTCDEPVFVKVTVAVLPVQTLSAMVPSEAESVGLLTPLKVMLFSVQPSCFTVKVRVLVP